jgi:hypothetical protein
MDILQYVLQYVPILIAIAGELGVIKFALNMIAKAKETKEFKAVVQQNKILIGELREAKRLNRELLTKIDRIHRGE